MRFSLIAAAFAAATLSWPVSSALALSATPPPAPVARSVPPSEAPPTKELGVDIGQAGSTSASVKAFVAGLASDTQAGVRGGCGTVTAYPASYRRDTLVFCELLDE